jgi:hypothetical protein
VASGFLTLADGSCFAPLVWAYDEVMRAVAEQLDGLARGGELKEWLLARIPGIKDTDLGYGPWFRETDKVIIDRNLDLRELTAENQKLFHDAALIAAEKVKSSEALKNPISLESHLLHLADAITRTDRGEPPLSHSMCGSLMPCQGRRIGPGW